MRRLRKRQFAWLGTLAVLVAIALIARDQGAQAMMDSRLARGTAIAAAIIVVVGAAALAASHLRRTRSIRRST